MCYALPASTASTRSAHRPAAWRTQRRTVAGCTPTSPATSWTGRPTPTSPTARARTSSAYGHATWSGRGTALAGTGRTGPLPARGTARAAAAVTEPGLAASPAEHLGDRLGLLAFKPTTGLPAHQPDLVTESRSLGPPWPACWRDAVGGAHATPLGRADRSAAVSHPPQGPVAITPTRMITQPPVGTFDPGDRLWLQTRTALDGRAASDVGGAVAANYGRILLFLAIWRFARPGPGGKSNEAAALGSAGL
jgi:hypothetical protein